MRVRTGELGRKVGVRSQVGVPVPVPARQPVKSPRPRPQPAILPGSHAPKHSGRAKEKDAVSDGQLQPGSLQVSTTQLTHKSPLMGAKGSSSGLTKGWDIGPARDMTLGSAARCMPVSSWRSEVASSMPTSFGSDGDLVLARPVLCDGGAGWSGARGLQRPLFEELSLGFVGGFLLGRHLGLLLGCHGRGVVLMEAGAM